LNKLSTIYRLSSIEPKNSVGWRLWLNQPTFNVGRISGEATPSDKNDELTWGNPIYHAVLNMQNNGFLAAFVNLSSDM
jgi:hypothetical protein